MDDLTLVRRLYRGRFAQKLAQELRRMSAEVQTAGHAGTITVKIDVKPAARETGDSEKRFLVAFNRKMPQGRAFETVMYMNDDGELQDAPPGQTVMEFRAVEPNEGTVREVGGTPPVVREA